MYAPSCASASSPLIIIVLRSDMQSFLLGAPHVVVGFRDQSGKLVAHQEFQTLQMPRLVRGKVSKPCFAPHILEAHACTRPQPHGWNPQYGLDYGSSVISWMHAKLSRANGKQKADPANPLVWRLDLVAPFDNITLRRLSDEEVRTEVQEGLDEDRAGFLPRKYFDWHLRGFRSNKAV